MKYWVYIEGRQQGPFELEQLYDLPVDRNTKVWFEGLPRWIPAGEAEPLACLFDGSPRPEAPETVGSDSETEASTDCGASADAVVAEESCESEEPVRKADFLRKSGFVQPAFPGSRIARHELPDEPCPPSYLGWSIALTVCCCSPLSLGALVASICVSSFYQGGNIDKARRASEWAAWLVMIAIALGFLPVMLMSAMF